jgi:hypothetical protein
VLTHFARKRAGMGDNEGNMLELMLLGGSTFGVIDHWWNGELMLIGDNIASDLLLGFVITLGIFIMWGALVAWNRMQARRIAPE